MIHVDLSRKQLVASLEMLSHKRRILVVPPGEGKTFTILNSYELLCKKYKPHKV